MSCCVFRTIYYTCMLINCILKMYAVCVYVCVCGVKSCPLLMYFSVAFAMVVATSIGKRC